MEKEAIETRTSSFAAGEAPAEPKTYIECGEIMRAIEVVERDSAAIAESFNSLFSSLRLALSEVTTTSVENMQCFSDVIGRVQESALDAATKGNRYINSCLRLNEEMKGVDSLAMRLYPFNSLFIKSFSFHAMREDKFLESLVSLCRLFFRQFLSFIFYVVICL